MALEIECKFLDVDHEALRGILRASSAECQGRCFEENLVFDTPGRTLKEAGVLLRLRRTRPLAAPGGVRGAARNVLTLKRPPDAPVPRGVKVWDESQTEVADFDAMRELVHGLGYAPAFAYEKVRETWRLGAAKVLLDTLPFGDFLEIEADQAVIRVAAGALGLDPARGSIATYHELNRTRRARLGLAPDESFVFDPARRSAYLAEKME